MPSAWRASTTGLRRVRTPCRVSGTAISSLSAADGQEFVLKVVDPAADASTLDCQSRVLRYLAEQAPSLPVPRIVETCDGQARWLAA